MINFPSKLQRFTSKLQRFTSKLQRFTSKNKNKSWEWDPKIPLFSIRMYTHTTFQKLTNVLQVSPVLCWRLSVLPTVQPLDWRHYTAWQTHGTPDWQDHVLEERQAPSHGGLCGRAAPEYKTKNWNGEFIFVGMLTNLVCFWKIEIEWFSLFTSHNFATIFHHTRITFPTQTGGHFKVMGIP